MVWRFTIAPRRFVLRQLFQIADGAEVRRQIKFEGAATAHLAGQIHESPITLDDADGGGETQAGSQVFAINKLTRPPSRGLRRSRALLLLQS